MKAAATVAATPSASHLCAEWVAATSPTDHYQRARCANPGAPSLPSMVSGIASAASVPLARAHSGRLSMAPLCPMPLHLPPTRPLHLPQLQPLSLIHTPAPALVVPTRLHHHREHTSLCRRGVNQPRTTTTLCVPATPRRTTPPLIPRPRTRLPQRKQSGIATTRSLFAAEVVLRTSLTNLHTAIRSDILGGSWSVLAMPAHTSAVSTAPTQHSPGVCAVS
jgi:hypothetical protein